MEPENGRGCRYEGAGVMMDQDRKDYDATMRDGKTPRCQQRVCTYSGTRWPHWHQCSRSAKMGDMCKQHDPGVTKARKSKARARGDAEFQARMVEVYGKHFLEALRKIAAGHNDARGLAQEEVDRFDER